MQKAERFRIILELLKEKQQLNTLGLSIRLDVSDDTIRRDLSELEEKGLLVKVHGGAISRSLIPLPIHERLSVEQEAKVALAKRAVCLMQPGQVIIMDGGSTNLEVARLIPEDLEIEVFTNSLPLATLLCDHPHAKIRFLGGSLFKPSQVSLGASVIEQLSPIRADLFFMGIAAIHEQFGATVPHYEEALVKRKMLAHSQAVVVMATQQKEQVVEKFKVCDISSIHYLFPASTCLVDNHKMR
ncbi:MAG: DeoR/GlpR family DNA-binding transcription regulator [Saprospiraceae bacterium]|nr:DeoR/GlpR family DNA-binding transcription regulator [Saprospiraceae bacterium]